MSNNMKSFVEIPIFLIMVSITLEGPVLTNLIIYRTCYVNLAYNKSECALLDSENKNETLQKLEETVQPYANVISMVIGLPTLVICAILAIFIGIWSDKYGRKPVMILSLLGQLISHLILIAFCTLPNLSSWFLTLTAIPVLFSGGFIAALIVFLSYLTDVTDKNKRGLRMGIFEIVLSLGGILGTISSSYVFKSIGYLGVYTVSTFCFLLAFLFTIYILEESVISEANVDEKFRNFFEMSQIKIMLMTTFKKRNGHRRMIILFCVIIPSFYVLGIMSGGSLNYMFLRLKFNWTLKDYTFFSSFRDLLMIFGTFLGIYGLHSCLKVDETILIIIGLISCLNGFLVTGLASTSFHVYFGGVLKLMGGNVTPMLRSLISKTVNPNEVGKIFSVMVILENFLETLGAPLYTYIYNKTLETRPEFFNFVSAGVIVFVLILSIIVSILWHSSRVEDDEEFISCLNDENVQE